MKKLYCTVFVFCSLISGIWAQDNSQTEPQPPAKSYFMAGITYLSNSVYNGRKDSLATPYITPLLGYYDKSGFFVNGSLSYLSRAGSSRIDLFELAAGYDFNIGKFDGEVAASKTFYNSQSTNVSSEVAGNVYASGGLDLDFIRPNFEAGIEFSSKPDYYFALGLEHTFSAVDDKLQITPAFQANGSTQNYYDSYIDNRKVGGKRKNTGTGYDITGQVVNASQFRILAYQFSLPVVYELNKLSFHFTPFYAIPVSPAVVVIQAKPSNGGSTITRSSAEPLSNTFYFSLGATCKF